MTEVARGPASRAALSPALLDALHKHYGMALDASTRDIGGSSNLNLFVLDGDSRYVVRVYRPWVTTARLADIQYVRRVLAEGGVPCVQPVPTRTGSSWITIDDRLVEVEPFIAHDAKMDSWGSLEVGLPTLGRIHSLLKDVALSADGHTPPAHNNIQPQDVLGGTSRGTARIRQWDASQVELQVADDADELAHKVDHAQQTLAPLQQQLVHGDYWDNNVFFREGQIVHIADLDFMGGRARIDDLALTIYYTNSTFADNQISDERISKLLMLVNTYNSGLSEPLTAAERTALPVALARAPLAFIAMIAVIDSEAGAREMASEMSADIEWALSIMANLDRWQTIFTDPY